MRREFFLYELTDDEFEDLAVSICHDWLGIGTSPFAPGKDGGRDARFNGKAKKYPNDTSPWDGHIVIQAKHTATPNASCSDYGFQKYYFPNAKGENGKHSEIPKIAALCKEEILDFYMVFTNRKLTGNAEKKLVKEIKKAGPKEVAIVGQDEIAKFLRENPTVANALPTAQYKKPFEFNPDDMVEVIEAVADVIKLDGSDYKSELDFTSVNKKKIKNKVNRLSNSYYTEVFVNQYMPLFPRLRDFLENDRNAEYRNLYHDIANELRQKVVAYRDRFDFFEDLLVYLYDLVKEARPELKGKRRFVTFLLCYMYDDCDIGERESGEQL